MIWLAWFTMFAVASCLYVNSAKQDPVLTMVDWLDIKEPHTSGSWQCILSVDHQIYRLVLVETGNFEQIVTLAGLTYVWQKSWHEVGTARLAVLREHQMHLQGMFSTSSDSWHITRNASAYYVYREHDSLLVSPVVDSLVHSGLFRRDTWPTYSSLQEQVGNTSDCFPEAMIAPIGVAADENFLQSFDSIADAYLHIADTVNKASQVWEFAFNITLSLIRVLTAREGMNYPWNWECNQTDNSLNSLQARLTALSDWRESSGNDDGLVLWSLFTNCPSSDVVGLAWQGSACSSRAANAVHHTVLDYRVFAHELGHVFGAVHDCTNVTCGTSTMCCPFSATQCDAHSQYIMSPGSDTQQFVFSECTRGNVCSMVRSDAVNTSCLLRQQTVPQIENRYCSTLEDTKTYERCWRDLQCMDYTNSTLAYSCGANSSCVLSCMNPATGLCHDYGIELLDGSPCMGQHSTGMCVAGKCELPGKQSSGSWIWVIISLGAALVAAAVIVPMFVLIWRRTQIQRASKLSTAKPVEIGPPHLMKQVITPAPVGVPRFLHHSHYVHDTVSTSSSSCSFSSDCDDK